MFLSLVPPGIQREKRREGNKRDAAGAGRVRLRVFYRAGGEWGDGSEKSKVKKKKRKESEVGAEGGGGARESER